MSNKIIEFHPLKTPMQTPKSTIFLDRDGCIIEDTHYLSQLSEIKPFAGVNEVLLKAKKAGYLLVMLTNQSGVAKGIFDEDFVKTANSHLNKMLGGVLDGIYYCPHRPDGNAPYNIHCDCRKPKTGMAEQAFKDLNLKKEGSWMIGDKMADVKLGQDFGIQSGLVMTGHGEEEKAKVLAQYPQTPVFSGLVAAIEEILKKN
ncbi:MAG: HAD family hydrolase [SAR324 cluster bacterium]|nr:HAD family hydrolase [SAR324 cluster bacterium]